MSKKTSPARSASRSARRKELRSLLKRLDRMIDMTTIDLEDAIAADAMSDVQIMLWNSRSRVEAALNSVVIQTNLTDEKETPQA